MPVTVVIQNNGRTIGVYESPIVPRLGEVLDTSKEKYIVMSVTHDIRGSFDSVITPQFDSVVLEVHIPTP